MHCFDDIEDLKDQPSQHVIRVLSRERNKFAKSRQEWIQAAFDLKNGDPALFDKLVVAELCDNCIRSYEKHCNQAASLSD